MSHCVADGTPNDSSTASGLQNAAEVSSVPFNEPSEQSYNPEPQTSSRTRKETTHHSSGTGKHHSHHRHRSPHKKTSAGKHIRTKSPRKITLFKKKDEKGKYGQHHHSSGQHHGRHGSPDKGYKRSRSAENALDGRHGGHRHGRSPERHHGRHTRHRSPYRSHRRSPHRSPHRSPRRSPYRSPPRYRSPHRSRHRSPTRRHDRSLDPYRRYVSPQGERQRGNEKPATVEAVLKEPSRSPEPSFAFEDTVLREPPALVRLNREAGEERPFLNGSLLTRASTMERAFGGDSLLRDISRNPRDTYRNASLPRVRTPDSDLAYHRYSSLLRGRSPKRADSDRNYPSRGSTPEPYRTRSLGRDISPIGSPRREDSEDEEDDDNFVAAKVREYYSTLKSDNSRPTRPVVLEPKKTYKDNPRDLSI